MYGLLFHAQAFNSGGVPMAAKRVAGQFREMATDRPDRTIENAVAKMVAEIMVAGAWQALDGLWILAMPAGGTQGQSSTLNLAALSANSPLLPVNSPTFTTMRGYAGDGATAYLNTGVVFSSAATKYKRDSLHMGVYIATANNASNTQMGLGTSTATRVRLRNPSGLEFFAAGATTGLAPTSTLSAPKYGAVSRNNSADYQYQINQGAPVTVTEASVAATGSPVMILKSNATFGSTSSIASAAHVGSQLSPTQLQSVYRALRSYMVFAGVET